MSKKKTVMLGLALLGLLGIWSASAMASWLDDITPYDGWAGTTSFAVDNWQSGGVEEHVVQLNGYIEWAVFGPGEFQANFHNSSYTPPAGEYTYVYQIHNSTDSPSISYYGVGLQNAADSVNWFVDSTVGVDGLAPSSTSLTSPSGAAEWFFNGILPGAASSGLIFSSSKAPMDYYSIVIDDGTYAIGEPVPSPSPNGIPEPATIWLLSVAICTMLAAYWRRGR